MAEKSLTLNEAMKQLQRINADKKLKQLLFYAEVQRLDENTRKSYEKELEDNTRKIENYNKKLEQSNKNLEQSNKKLEQSNKKLEQSNKKLENNNKSLEEDNRKHLSKIKEQEYKIQNLINALYQNNSIEEISKITNLEIDYIKDILNM